MNPSPVGKNGNTAESDNNLSAKGSTTLPKFVTMSKRRAIYPSVISVKLATTYIIKAAKTVPVQIHGTQRNKHQPYQSKIFGIFSTKSISYSDSILLVAIMFSSICFLIFNASSISYATYSLL